MRSNRSNHVGIYQRPAPPKTKTWSGDGRPAQAPPVPLHEIEARGRSILQELGGKIRKPGRPAVFEQPMTPAQRQARRRALKAREREIEDARRINDNHGKSHMEAHSGGYGPAKVENMLARLGREADEPIGRGRGGKVSAGGIGADETPHDDELRGDGLSSGFHVRGLQVGDEESNRVRFAENELVKLVGECFTAPERPPAAKWIAWHVGNDSLRRQDSPSLTLTCTKCGEQMESVEDATDHLRVDHREVIDQWFAQLRPAREFRDMGSYVTVILPKKRRKPSD